MYGFGVPIGVGDNFQIFLCRIDECFASLFLFHFWSSGLCGLEFWQEASKNSGPPGNLLLNWRLDFWQLICSSVKDGDVGDWTQ